MISTVTLNTSVDKAYQLAGPLVDGTVMRVATCIDNAGGKGLNAARAVATCGEKVVATGFAGGNNGRLLCELLDADGIEHDFVNVASETRCCVNVLEPDGRSTEFLEPGRPVAQTDMRAIRRRVAHIAGEADVVTIDGSVPEGAGEDTYRELVAIVRAAGVPVILDTSGSLLVRSLESRPTMIKPNADEIAAILGRRPSSIDEVIGAAREVHERYGIERVVVSLGGEGSVMACGEGTFHGHAPKIEVVNPVGSGDTMVGAMAVAMARRMSVTDQLAYAISCASANCLTASTGHFDLSVAEGLRARTTVERVA
ncbi:1-phosphofructokinase family hexose kinase [Thermophilibacter immobilis]|jgi:tagatose 6-phosphate kinase|uniref:1-phosphofructokinase family hexose kinase n=1 Tax=Thermophilibacter immobilis TaxID=2779519 RepID=A0A7S7M919_9ACTN|nr:1-phosphofructokinase family hexose kinase [Thermophilibacter immobilis]QOY60970.1 1-phosphofructokinase family hexose kinase [Thermophilibacter immobilis]